MCSIHTDGTTAGNGHVSTFIERLENGHGHATRAPCFRPRPTRQRAPVSRGHTAAPYWPRKTAYFGRERRRRTKTHGNTSAANTRHETHAYSWPRRRPFVAAYLVKTTPPDNLLSEYGTIGTGRRPKRRTSRRRPRRSPVTTRKPRATPHGRHATRHAAATPEIGLFWPRTDTAGRGHVARRSRPRNATPRAKYGKNAADVPQGTPKRPDVRTLARRTWERSRGRTWTKGTHKGTRRRREDGRTATRPDVNSETGRDNGTKPVWRRPAGGVPTRERLCTHNSLKTDSTGRIRKRRRPA